MVLRRVVVGVSSATTFFIIIRRRRLSTTTGLLRKERECGNAVVGVAAKGDAAIGPGLDLGRVEEDSGGIIKAIEDFHGFHAVALEERGMEEAEVEIPAGHVLRNAGVEDIHRRSGSSSGVEVPGNSQSLVDVPLDGILKGGSTAQDI